MVSQTGSTTSLPATNGSWATEIALDVEWSNAVAPGAKILLVEANSDSDSDLYTAVNYARNYTNVVAVSNSWGGSEDSSETSDDSYFTTPSGHTGVTFLVASGDSGAPAEYPESSPNVLAVGGTSLTLTAQNTISSETVWNSDGGSLTGGLSAYESAPSYQSGLVIHNGSSTISAGGKRATPDVAYDADPNTGFGVYDSLNNGTTTPWGEWGGTSDAAPQWSGIIAIANQGRAANGEAFLDGVSQVLPMLYSVASSGFNDITSGSSGGSPVYTAGTGFDLCTGLGSPKASVLVADLVGSTTQAATQFSVTASPASSTAGATISVTVSAETSSARRRHRLSRHCPFHQQRQPGRAAVELYLRGRRRRCAHLYHHRSEDGGQPKRDGNRYLDEARSPAARRSPSARPPPRNSPSASSPAACRRARPFLRPSRSMPWTPTTTW